MSLVAGRVRFLTMAAPGPLHPLESEIMEQIWARSEATVREVQEALNARGQKVRAYTTLLTVMTRLDAKGLLVRRRAGRLDIYAPALSRAAYLQREPRPRWPRWSTTSASSRSRTSRATSARSIRSGWKSSAGWANGELTHSPARRARGGPSFGRHRVACSLLIFISGTPMRFHGDVLARPRV